MKHTILVISYLILTIKLSYGQNKFFRPGELQQYNFIYTNSVMDTVAIGNISVTPSNDAWEFDDQQKEVTYKYNFLKRDDEYFKIGEHVLTISNEIRESTGYIENDDKFWMHPFRANIFYITEIAPFPKYLKGTTISQSKSKLIIGAGWGKFKGKSKRVYTVSNNFKGHQDYTEMSLKQVKAKSKHRLGKSFLDMIGSDEYGILEMNYKFFNRGLAK